MTIGFLSGLGHDVVPAAQIGLVQGEDADLLPVARAPKRILVARGRDFGALVFVQGSGRSIGTRRNTRPTLIAEHLVGLAELGPPYPLPAAPCRPASARLDGNHRAAVARERRGARVFELQDHVNRVARRVGRDT
jgi:hypothetical protein